MSIFEVGVSITGTHPGGSGGAGEESLARAVIRDGSFPTCCRARGAAARKRSSKTSQKFRLTELTRLTLRPSVDDRPHGDGMIGHSPSWGT